MHSLLSDAAAIRAAAFFGPVLATMAAAGLLRPSGAEGRRTLAAVIVATAWSAVTLYPLNLAALHFGWWSFHAEGAVFGGVPVDLWAGWAVLWGALPAVLVSKTHLVVLVAGLAWLDVALMPLAAPVVELGASWFLGGSVGLLACLLPAALLARWTVAGRKAALRSWAQVALAGAALLLFPAHVLESEPAWAPPVNGMLLQFLLLVCLPGLAAARELASAGGTPLPFDPPRRLVASGPYAYLRNPMQASIAAAFPIAALLTAEPWLLAGSAIAVAYGAGLADWHEDRELGRRHAEVWRRYRAAVRPWLPRLRPWPGRTEAVLFVAQDCAMCRGVGSWLSARRPVALRVRPAASHPGRLRRLRYEDEAGERASGILGLAKAMEHLHFGWALVGWGLALPGVGAAVQFVADTIAPVAPTHRAKA